MISFCICLTLPCVRVSIILLLAIIGVLRVMTKTRTPVLFHFPLRYEPRQRRQMNLHPQGQLTC